MLAGVRLPSLGINDSRTGLGYKVAALTYWTAIGGDSYPQCKYKKVKCLEPCLVPLCTQLLIHEISYSVYTFLR